MQERESCQAVISQSKRKWKCHGSGIGYYGAVCLPHPGSFFKGHFLLPDSCVRAFWERQPIRQFSQFFPGCWFWPQDRVFVVMPLHLNPALTTVHQVLAEGLLTRDSYSLLWKSWTGIQGQALSPWAHSISHYGLEGSFSEIQHWDDKSINSFAICFFVNTQTWSRLY